ncbi:MAG TPA: hypothetical protein PKY81_07030 [bacterium]|nr:hypothetical protein [bacterium]
MIKIKHLIALFFLIIFCSADLKAFVVLENTEQIKKYAFIEILPVEAAEGAYFTINNGEPMKFIVQKQLVEYYKSSDDKIKIDLTMPFDSKYKNSIYYFNESSDKDRVISVLVSRKLSEESKKIAKLITSMANSIMEYNESGNVEDFKSASKNFGSIYYLDVFVKELCELDSEEMNEFLNIIKYGLYLPNENYEVITQKIIENISQLKKAGNEIKQLNDSNSNYLRPEDKRNKLDGLTQNINDIFWNTFEIVKSYKKIQTDAVSGR